jgi:hypothetical protein
MLSCRNNITSLSGLLPEYDTLQGQAYLEHQSRKPNLNPKLLTHTHTHPASSIQHPASGIVSGIFPESFDY